MHEHRPTQCPDLSSRTVEREMLVLDRAASRIHLLNVTASFIWSRCDGQHTAGQIADELAGCFEIDADAARAAVASSLRQLDALGLLLAGTA